MYFIFLKSSLKTICLFIIIFLCINSRAADGNGPRINQCHFLLSATPYGEIHPTFNHNTRYDFELDEQTIKNQCSTEHCHMYAWASELESKSGIQISNTYLDAMNIYNVAVESLTKGLTSIKFGTQSLTASRKRIADIGIIPTSAWLGNDSFIKSKSYNRLLTAIESVIVNYIEKIKVAPFSERPSQFYEFKNVIFQLIEQIAGPFPKTFKYDGQTYTPKSFATHYFPELELPLTEVTVNMKDDLTTVERDLKNLRVLKISTPRYTTEKILKKVLDSGRPIYFAYTHENQYIDEDTGIMSISAFSYPEIAKIMDRDIMNAHWRWKGNHAVLIVGYQMDPNNERIVKWKIQNSWGTSAGDHGYFHMYQDYMDMFGWGFSFVDDGSIDFISELNTH